MGGQMYVQVQNAECQVVKELAPRLIVRERAKKASTLPEVIMEVEHRHLEDHFFLYKQTNGFSLPS